MADFWDTEEVIGKLEKNSREEIYIKKVSKGGKRYVDIRVFWFDGNTDEFRPSQKGVTIPYDSLEDFKKIVNDIE